MLKVYAAGGWFTPGQEEVQTRIENYLKGKDSVKPYFPRHDGVKLEAGQFHDPKLREKVFLDNLDNIVSSDFIIANLDGREGFMDTGTCYEVGYAMALGIPVIGYQEDGGKLLDLMGSVASGFVAVCTGIDELDSVVNTMKPFKISRTYSNNFEGSKVLYISPDNNEKNINNGLEVANVLIEGYGKNFRWVDKLNDITLSKYIDETFNDVEYMVAVIDDRHPIVSWMMGQAFARHVPIVSYTNYDFGVNLMLICSIVTHVKGINNLKSVVQNIKREGIDSLDKFDNKDIKVF